MILLRCGFHLYIVWLNFYGSKSSLSANLTRLEVQYLQSDTLNIFLGFLQILRFLDNGSQTCLIFWNMCLVFRFVTLYAEHNIYWIQIELRGKSCNMYRIILAISVFLHFLWGSLAFIYFSFSLVISFLTLFSAHNLILLVYGNSCFDANVHVIVKLS